ncbi:hypothetical protein L2E82_48651 [Cichorium intybus]|uniref:Uncharacterized protein n=1 Tax=Cichorium intybus TaxID=13427 RepID=A0ACB8YYK7_CICIN|nr:hypothetical protein L2E82_48651 [Cichorium intybus]
MTDIVVSLETALDYQEGAGRRSDVTPSEEKIQQSQWDTFMLERKRKRIISQIGSERRSRMKQDWLLKEIEEENLILREQLSKLDKVISTKGDNHSLES